MSQSLRFAFLAAVSFSVGVGSVYAEMISLSTHIGAYYYDDTYNGSTYSWGNSGLSTSGYKIEQQTHPANPLINYSSETINVIEFKLGDIPVGREILSATLVLDETSDPTYAGQLNPVYLSGFGAYILPDLNDYYHTTPDQYGYFGPRGSLQINNGQLESGLTLDFTPLVQSMYATYDPNETIAFRLDGAFSKSRITYYDPQQLSWAREWNYGYRADAQFVVELAPVPEATSMTLVAAAILGMGFRAFRRKTSRVN